MKRKEKRKDDKEVRESSTPKMKLKINPISVLIFCLVIGVVFGICYYFLGFVEAGIIIAGLLFTLLIGSILDKPKSKSKGRKALKIIIIIFLILTIIALIGAWAEACKFISEVSYEKIQKKK